MNSNNFELHCLDLKKGLESLFDMHDVHYKLLITYYENYQNVRCQIENLMNNKNYLQIQAIVHSIKGISLNLCSDELYNITSNLNVSLKKDSFCDDDMIEKFLNYHDLLLAEIKTILEEKNV